MKENHIGLFKTELAEQNGIGLGSCGTPLAVLMQNPSKSQTKPVPCPLMADWAAV
jgi:hypothetical protein